MKRIDAIAYVGHIVDTALSADRKDYPLHATRFIGWQCGFEPMFVAVCDAYGRDVPDCDEAVDIAKDYLAEIGWFANGATEPDYIL